MKVFLSWSGERSRMIAEAFKDWLPLMLQALEPWISTDIEKGGVWDKNIQEALNNSRVCIICLTKENLNSVYIHYEAGAIANLPDGSAKTFLYNIKNSDVKQPLARFQSTLYNKNDVFKLIVGLNDVLKQHEETHVSDAMIEKIFELNWPSFRQILDTIPKADTHAEKRSADDKLDEILNLVRVNSVRQEEKKIEFFRPEIKDAPGLRLELGKLIKTYLEQTKMNQEIALLNIGKIKAAIDVDDMFTRFQIEKAIKNYFYFIDL